MKKSKEIALGGMTAAVAIVIMCLGGMIPFMTYVSPVICMVIGGIILKIMSKTGFFTWYFAVAMLSLLLSPDKEAAFVFAAFGCYPAVRIFLEKLPLKWVFKIAYFNVAILLIYWLLINLMGMQELSNEFANVGRIMTVFMLVVGNVIFILLDHSLRRLDKVKKSKAKKE